MDDLFETLKQQATVIADVFGATHLEVVLFKQAAARIEAQDAMLRECVEALEKITTRFYRCIMSNGTAEEFADIAVSNARATLTRAKDVLK